MIGFLRRVNLRGDFARPGRPGTDNRVVVKQRFQVTRARDKRYNRDATKEG